jgi:1,3-beta-glucanosyltransferase GAS5
MSFLVVVLVLLIDSGLFGQKPSGGVVVHAQQMEIDDGDKYVQCDGGVTVNPVVLEGKRFYDSSTGEYFPVKGIAYYPRPNNGTDDMVQYNSNDFFTDEWEDLWTQDIPFFEQLGVNALRIYAVDPSKNHDRFMCRLQQAGIYVIVGLLAECENCAIGPNEAPGCYPPGLKERGQFIINEFSRYSNTLAFSAGNEVTLYTPNRQIEINAPCQKKFLRDMRAYINGCIDVPNTILPRRVPVGMVNWDALREIQSQYFICRTDPDDLMENAEWYGMNIYQHCSPEAETVDDLLGWATLRDDFAALDHPIPIIIAEYGCREPFPEIDGFEAQRTWLQVDALYREDYVEVFAGGVVFEFSAEKYIIDQDTRGHPWPYYQFMKIHYGVGYYSPVDCDHINIPCEYIPYPEFDLLAAKLANVDNSWVPDMSNTNKDIISFARSLPTCPDGIAAISDFQWEADDEPDLPCYAIETNAPTVTPVETPTVGEPTIAPTTIQQPNSGPTNKPVVDFFLPTDGPTGAPGVPSSGSSIFSSLLSTCISIASIGLLMRCIMS